MCFQFCGCQCQPGYTGSNGGVDPHTKIVESACGSLGLPGTSNYESTDSNQQCTERCSYLGRTTLCGGNGYTPAGYVLAENIAGYGSYLEMDCFAGAGQSPGCTTTWPAAFQSAFGTPTVGMCICDPGYYGFLNFVACMPIQTGFCSGNGYDITGPPKGVGSCPATGPWGFGPLQAATTSTICGQRYSSTAPAMDQPSPKCLCQPGFIGAPTITTQCSQAIQTVTCNGQGMDHCTTCQYPASTSLGAPSCLCNPGWVPNLSSGTDQCAFFGPCTSFNPVCGGNGQCSSADDFSQCHCNTGFGGYACCPGQFGSSCPGPSCAICNGQGTCTNSGTCSCPAGTLPPGCCTGCDSTQGCLGDGRCDCPVLGSVQCGAYGTGCVNAAIRTCTFRNATVNGFSIQLGGMFGCPLIQGTACGPHGICTHNVVALNPGSQSNTVTGSCQCLQDLPVPYNRTGPFCCPIAPGQTQPCGNRGFCDPYRGVCQCNNLVIGQACETVIACDPSQQSQCTLGQECQQAECSGNGKCLQNTDGLFGLGDYLAQMQFGSTLCTGSYVTRDNVVFTSCQLIQFLLVVYRAFYQLDPSVTIVRNIPESDFYSVPYATCTAGLSQAQCYWNSLVSMAQNMPPTGTPSQFTLCSLMASPTTYVNQAFALANPTRVPFLVVGNYYNQLVNAFSACTSAISVAEGMAAILLWDVWYQLYRGLNAASMPDTINTFSVPQPNLPVANPGTEWQCQCPAGTGGVQCQISGCPLGANGQSCTGFVNGIFQGACIGNSRCECSPAFGCTNCACPKSPGCYPTGGSAQNICGGARGSCVQVNSSTTFQCSCLPAYYGQYCQDVVCQPPGQP
jgi:hypothetical protein